MLELRTAYSRSFCGSRDEIIFIETDLLEKHRKKSHPIGSVKHGALRAYQFKAVEGKGIDRVPVMDGTAPERGVVETDPVEQEKVLPPGEAADERGAVAVCRFLDNDTRRVAEGFG